MPQLENEKIASYLAAAWVACALASGCGPPPQDGRTNIVLLTLDTLRADHVGAYAPNGGFTPALDALAAEGLVHENAYTTIPITGPAHLSLFTGLYPSEHGARSNGLALPLPALPHTLVPRLADAGYATAAFVSTSLLDYRNTGLPGFEIYDSPTVGENSNTNYTRRGDQTVNAALDWLASEKRRPSFLWVHLYDAHAPYGTAEDQPGGLHDWTGYGFVEPSLYPDARSRTRMRNLYARGISELDRFVGRLIEGARDRLRSAPLVIAVGDHGESLDEHLATRGYAYDHGEFLDAETVRIPLVIAGPSIPASRSSGTASIRDLYTTILEAAGVGDPDAGDKQRRDLRSPNDELRVLGIERRDMRHDSVREQHFRRWHAAAAAAGEELVVVDENGSATLRSHSAPLLEIARQHAEAANRTPTFAERDAATQKMLRELGYLD